MAICVFVHLILKVSPCQPVDACEEKLAAETASTAINAVYSTGLPAVLGFFS